ncbi:hypothetical protein L1987_36106 [Smallanthus sonchifolius]|uniref:Uncharacterized protein n=1 Tax=Smallanthus sonchifolius TaxID=185202 RepID=A0ACB9HD55_9ASTR|nr:hypothetical protein L1987_36106 [Smallanthus sonchifolius]
MAFNMWGGGAAGFTDNFVRECGTTFAKRVNQATLDLILNEECFDDLNPTTYESQKAGYKQTVEDLGYHEQHIQCLKDIDQMSDLKELSSKSHLQNRVVFGAHLQALKAKYELFLGTNYKRHDYKEFDDELLKEFDNDLLKEYTRLTSEIWSDIEEIEAELKDNLVNELEPYKKTLYAARHKVLYPFCNDLYKVYPTLSLAVGEIVDVVVLEPDIVSTYERFRDWTRTNQSM